MMVLFHPRLSSGTIKIPTPIKLGVLLGSTLLSPT
jgi:hypothetical protein